MGTTGLNPSGRTLALVTSTASAWELAGRQPAADYVLSRMRPADLDAMRLDAAVAADAVEALVAEGLAAAQNRFNS